MSSVVVVCGVHDQKAARGPRTYTELQFSPPSKVRPAEGLGTSLQPRRSCAHPLTPGPPRRPYRLAGGLVHCAESRNYLLIMVLSGLVQVRGGGAGDGMWIGPTLPYSGVWYELVGRTRLPRSVTVVSFVASVAAHCVVALGRAIYRAMRSLLAMTLLVLALVFLLDGGTVRARNQVAA